MKVISFILFLKTSFSLIVYKSNEPLQSITPFSGITAFENTVKKSTNFERGISICVRFNYQKLTSESWVFVRPHLTRLFAGYAESFLFFGGKNWIVKEVWVPNTWHHICLSYDRETSHLSLIKVSYSW